MRDADLLEDASVLRGLWRVSNGRVLPHEADELEIWEIAVLLGHATELEDGGEKPGSGASPDRDAFHAASRARLRQRLDHRRGNAPAPEAAPVDPSALSAIQGLARGSP